MFEEVFQLVIVISSMIAALLAVYMFRDYRKGKKEFSEVLPSIRSAFDFFEILNDEESRRALITVLVSEAYQVIQYSLMGQASGDSKKSAKAQRLVREFITTKAIPKVVGGPYADLLEAFMHFAGVKEWMEEDPEAMEYLAKAARPILRDLDLGGILGGGLDRPRDYPRDSDWY